MLLKRQFYKLNDKDPRGMFEVKPSQAVIENKKGFGIFWTVNNFNGARRIENVININSWAIDIDEGTKEEQMKTIQKGLEPSLIVESKKGYHVYFNAKNGNSYNYRAILEQNLVPFYNADKRAKDIARVLRVPGFYHNKQEPYLIKTVYQSNAIYTEKAIFDFYPLVKPEIKKLKTSNTPVSDYRQFTNIKDRIYNLDCIEGLQRLSGTSYVNGEQFDFVPMSNGTHQIAVNGKTTGCWIDRNGHIGTQSGEYAVTVFNWLKYYGHNDKEVYEILEREFSELWQGLK